MYGFSDDAKVESGVVCNNHFRGSWAKEARMMLGKTPSSTCMTTHASLEECRRCSAVADDQEEAEVGVGR